MAAENQENVNDESNASNKSLNFNDNEFAGDMHCDFRSAHSLLCVFFVVDSMWKGANCSSTS